MIKTTNSHEFCRNHVDAKRPMSNRKYRSNWGNSATSVPQNCHFLHETLNFGQSPWTLCLNKCVRPDKVPQRVMAGWAGRCWQRQHHRCCWFKPREPFRGPIIHADYCTDVPLHWILSLGRRALKAIKFSVGMNKSWSHDSDHAVPKTLLTEKQASHLLN